LTRGQPWRNRFRQGGRRWTEPRAAILSHLIRTAGHPTAKEIFGSLRRISPGVGLTTVYRTLELMQKMGLVHKVDAGDGQSRYALKREGKEDHHHHLICTRCGKIIDYQDFVEDELELIRKTEATLSKKHDFAITDHNIEFLGLCGQCRRRPE
jgi:Fur family ferric uptake transcriptional regulator